LSFLFAFALAAVVLVGAPYFAHRLRRRKAETRAFAPAHLVPPAPPRARRRSELEDRALFGTRALAVLALALLGASPFVRCSRLSLSRTSGASVALAVVLDDSMSMQAKLGAKTRWERAKEGAAELLASTRDGDAVTIVLAGAPARVALAPTTDLRAARATLESIPESDRATDLDGALAMARSLLDGLPQVDRRVVVLSDLADGVRNAPPLGQGSPIPVWNALPDLRAEGSDCAVLRADRSGLRVRVHLACSPGFDATRFPPRTVAVSLGGKVVAAAPAPVGIVGDVVLTLPKESLAKAEEPGELVARLRGTDSIASDDSAPVVAEAVPGSIAVVVPSDTEVAATGGAPVVEQALTALSLDVAVRPLPQIPDRLEDLSAFVGIILDDPPGFTPEERRALGGFVERGGVVLLALGPRAAAPPLGASLEPFLEQPTAWDATASPGVDAATADGLLAESAASLSDIGAHRRTVLRPEDTSRYTPLLAWSDHAPLVARRTIGRGEAWIVTLPFALDASDLALRPSFLAILGAWVDTARGRTAPKRTEVGTAWTFPGAHKVTVTGPGGADVPVQGDGPSLRVAPPHIGFYRLQVDGRNEGRVAEPASRELDLRPRSFSAAAGGRAFGENRSAIDASPALAVGLLGLLVLELVLRIRAGRKTDALLGASM
jgi:Mg-chelatase subunit ChlD